MSRGGGSSHACSASLALGIVAGLVGFGVWTKLVRRAEADAVMQARQSAIPTVRTFTAKADNAPRTIEFTGNMAAFDSAIEKLAQTPVGVFDDIFARPVRGFGGRIPSGRCKVCGLRR